MKLDSSKTIKPVSQTNWKADFPDQMVVLRRRENWKNEKKTLGAEKRTNHKLKSDTISD